MTTIKFNCNDMIKKDHDHPPSPKQLPYISWCFLTTPFRIFKIPNQCVNLPILSTYMDPFTIHSQIFHFLPTQLGDEELQSSMMLAAVYVYLWVWLYSIHEYANMMKLYRMRNKMCACCFSMVYFILFA
jgi:hypothetical protein